MPAKTPKPLYYFFHHMRLKRKFMALILLVLLLPSLFLYIFLYTRLSSIIRSNTLASSQALVSQTASALEGQISRLRHVMDSLSGDRFFQDYLLHSQAGEAQAQVWQSPQALDFFSSLQDYTDGQLISAIRIYAPDMPSLPGKAGLFLRSDFDILGSYWHGIFSGSPQTESLLCPEFYLSYPELDTLGDMAYIRKFTLQTPSREHKVYVAIYFSKQPLLDLLRQNSPEEESVYYIINSRNSLAGASHAGLAGTYFMRYDSLPALMGSSYSFTTATILGEPLYLSYRQLHQTDWRLVSVIPKNRIFSQEEGLLRAASYGYLFFILLTLAISLLLSDSLSRRLSRLISTMDKQEEQPLQLESARDRDEIGHLISHYNRMVIRLQKSLDEQKKAAEALKVSEVRALQAQINPHFLYNMLDMINWLAQSGKQQEVSLAIQTLSKFYKLTLSRRNILIPIREELRHVELYVALQNMRYENKIGFLIDVPEQFLDAQIPKLVLQPIVENSIQHGIFEKEEKAGEIVIMAWQEAGDILFVISDDGVGIQPDKLRALPGGSLPPGKGSNIGIYNTHQRLRLLYGPAYGLEFSSHPGCGTEVRLRIPLHAKEGMDQDSPSP